MPLESVVLLGGTVKARKQKAKAGSSSATASSVGTIAIPRLGMAHKCRDRRTWK